MEENWVEVYSETLQHEALVRITDEIEKNSEFVINKNNVGNYFNCNSFLDVLDANNIEYKLELNRAHEWRDREGDRLGEVYLSVYIKESDEDKLTITEPGFYDLPKELQGVNLNDPEEDNEDGPLEKIGKNFMNIILIILTAIFIGLAISANDEIIRRVLIIIGIIPIIEIIKLNKKKKTRRTQ